MNFEPGLNDEFGDVVAQLGQALTDVEDLNGLSAVDQLAIFDRVHDVLTSALAHVGDGS